MGKDPVSKQRRGSFRSSEVPMERFMQPCLLFLLHGHKAHGYELIQNLSGFGFHASALDPGTVYRNLRKLEEEGSVASQWDTSEGGPAKRIYQLTLEGEEALRVWAEQLRHKIGRLTHFIEKYDSRFNSQ